LNKYTNYNKTAQRSKGQQPKRAMERSYPAAGVKLQAEEKLKRYK
jgi:hypothetical protein